MSRPAAEEQFLEQTPWANPQHPVHQHQHIGRLSRQVSDQIQTADANFTPATQKSMVDPNIPVSSASTIAELLSAQASSALATPYSNNEGLRHQQSEITATSSYHRLPAEKSRQQRERLQSLSPTETRKHNLVAYEGGPDKLNSNDGTAEDMKEVSSHSYKPSRIAFLGSSGRPESLPRNGPSNAEISGRHPTSSPITLHQHVRENNLTAAPGLSRIGAR